MTQVISAGERIGDEKSSSWKEQFGFERCESSFIRG
jgi:hypothetical protein